MRVLIASSATGGHIYPALAIADEIKRRDPKAELLFVGAKWEIGKGIVKAAGYSQVFVDAKGFDRKNPFKNIETLASLVRVSREIKSILREFSPDICIGTGGHVSGPVIRSAMKAGIRTMIQEQNVIPGMANRLAERYADKIFAGFEDTVKYFKNPGKVIVSGNPVRGNFTQANTCRAEMRAKYELPKDAFCVLIFGGSQGAGAINKAAVDAIRVLNGSKYSFILITGRDYYDGIVNELKAIQGGATDAPALCLEYTEDIHELYAAADLIVSRSGALTVTEIAHSGRASILIPSPNVTNNHQYYNAKTLADAGAAVILTEDELKSGDGGLIYQIERLSANPDKVLTMGKTAAECAKTNAVKVIVDELLGA